MTPRNKARIAFIKCLRATTPWHLLNDALAVICDVQKSDTTFDEEIIELARLYCHIRELERAARINAQVNKPTECAINTLLTLTNWRMKK